jgi:hypothetical protein
MVSHRTKGKHSIDIYEDDWVFLKAYQDEYQQTTSEKVTMAFVINEMINVYKEELIKRK